MNLGDIIQELTDADLDEIDEQLHRYSMTALTEVCAWYIDNFNTETSTIDQDIKYKKIIKFLLKMIKEKAFVDGI